MIDISLIEQTDPEIAEALKLELDRQQNNIELIASENFVSPAVMAAAGSHLTNKYAEGYPEHRYYGGFRFVDIAEDLARDRLKQLFGCEYCNVQAHSGASANLAVLFTKCQPREPLMGMHLAPDRHLGYESRPRRTPFARLARKYFRQILQYSPLRR